MAGEGKRFVKGIFKDTAHIDQPEGSWRYARNIIMTDKDGSISNEGGNTPMEKLLVPNPFIYGGPNENLENYLCIGVIPIDNDRMIFFLRDRRPVTTTFIQRSEIGLFDPSRDTGLKYTRLYSPVPVEPNASNDWKGSNDLNFQLTNPIEGTFKIDSRNNVIIYWTDDLNPPRTFNVTRQLKTFEDQTGTF